MTMTQIRSLNDSALLTMAETARERVRTASLYGDESEAAEWRADLDRAQSEIQRREI